MTSDDVVLAGVQGRWAFDGRVGTWLCGAWRGGGRVPTVVRGRVLLWQAAGCGGRCAHVGGE